MKTRIDSQWLKIYKDDILYLAVYIPSVHGYQAWIETENWFCVHLYVEKLEFPVMLEIANFEMWKEVIKILDENI